jgi:protein-S-isoprenylcysteine O-methyltransferase Ste14
VAITDKKPLVVADRYASAAAGTVYVPKLPATGHPTLTSVVVEPLFVTPAIVMSNRSNPVPVQLIESGVARLIPVVPKERIMSAKFGRDYDDYRKRVRRWL